MSTSSGGSAPPALTYSAAARVVPARPLGRRSPLFKPIANASFPALNGGINASGGGVATTTSSGPHTNTNNTTNNNTNNTTNNNTDLLAGGPRVLDCFCGIGGSSRGAVLAGYTIAVATDGCPTALAAYSANAPSHLTVQLDAADSPSFVAGVRQACAREGISPKFDIALVSLPCQAFSSASNSRATDTRRGLASLFLPSLIALAPSAIVFENVPNFGTSAEWRAVRSRLAQSYNVREYVINSAKCAVPQRRLRFFAVCTPRGAVDVLTTAVAALGDVAETNMEDVFPQLGLYFHLPRGAHDPAVFSTDRPSPTVRTTCASRPNLAKFTPRPRDAGCITDAAVLPVSTWARVMGFPPGWRLPVQRQACTCPFCASSRRAPAARLIGNAVCPPVMAFILKNLRHLFPS